VPGHRCPGAPAAASGRRRRLSVVVRTEIRPPNVPADAAIVSDVVERALKLPAYRWPQSY
jgi:hypothetical protein